MSPSTETSDKPKGIDDATFEAASLIVRLELGGHSAAHKTAYGLTVIIARAILAAKAAEREAILQFEFDLPIYQTGADMMIATREYIRKRGG